MSNTIFKKKGTVVKLNDNDTKKNIKARNG
jgi:hypothetical protein